MTAQPRRRETPSPTPDMLERIRDAVRRDRDLRLEIGELERQLKLRAADLVALEHEELPDLFSQVHMGAFTLDAEGNQPAYTARMSPYYKANIAAEWDPERRERAFAWLAARDPDTGGPGPRGGDNPDIIKTEVVVQLGRGERATASRLEAWLRDNQIPYTWGLSVPWNTLTAFVKELVEARKIMPPLDLLGATVGRIVTIKPERK